MGLSFNAENNHNKYQMSLKLLKEAKTCQPPLFSLLQSPDFNDLSILFPRGLELSRDLHSSKLKVEIHLAKDWFRNEHVSLSWPMSLEGKPGVGPPGMVSF